MDEEYISRIILELQPRSRRSCRRLFGIRENKCFNKNSFDLDQFRNLFLHEYNRKVVKRGEHIKCDQLILAVKRIERASTTTAGNTSVEFTLRGSPLKIEEEEMEGKLNESFVNDKKIENIPCYCCECKQSLSDGDLFIKSENWNRPILCLSCYDLFCTHKCVRCTKAITFEHNSLNVDGFGCIRFVEHNNLYWHSDCCVCVTCLESLIGKKYYEDEVSNQLFCLDHIPY